MPKTVQIRDIPDDVYAALAKWAAETGISVPELLRREVSRLAARPTLSHRVGRVAATAAAGGSFRR